MCKTSAKKCFKTLQNIFGDYIEHDCIYRFRRFLNIAPEVSHTLNKVEKDQFMDACLEFQLNPTCTSCHQDLDISKIFPHIQEVIDYNPKETKSYFHREKKTNQNADGVGDNTVIRVRYVDKTKISFAVTIKLRSRWYR